MTANFSSNGHSNHPQHSRMVEPLISLYQDGEASPAERQVVENYLTSCADCRAIFAEYQQVAAGLRSYLNRVAEPNFGPQAFAFLREAQGKPAHSTSVAPLNQRPVQPLTRPARFGRQLAFRFSGVAVALLLVVAVASLALINRPDEPSAPVSIVVGGQASPGSSPTTTDNQPSVTSAPETTTASFTTSAPTTTAAFATTEAPTIAQTARTTASVASSSLAATTASVTQRPSGTTRAASNTVAVATATAFSVPTNTPEPPVRTTAAPTPTVAEATTAPAATTEAATPTPTEAVRLPSTETPTSLTTTAPATATSAPTTAIPATTVAPTTAVPTTVAPTPRPASGGSNAPGWIAYISKADGQIHLVRSDGSGDLVLSDEGDNPAIGWEQLVWSSDGRYLAAVGAVAGKWERGIYLLDPVNPGKAELLTEGIAPTWSPDNRSLVYLAGPLGTKNNIKQGRPALYDLRKRSPQILATTLESFAPQWFADNARVLIGQDRIYDLNMSQLSTFKLPFTNDCVGASLSPTGNKLAVLEQTNGKFETVIYDFKSGKVEPKDLLVRTAAPVQGRVGQVCGAQRLHWTQDSRYVFYYTSNGASFSTCLVQAAAGTPRCLTDIYDPSFTADSTSLADYNPSGGLVYTMPTSLTKRPDNPRWIAEAKFAPAWQPRY